jgi:hypothetical protein
MATRQYTRGLQKLFTRFYGLTQPGGQAHPADPSDPESTIPMPGDPLPESHFIDLINDEICMCLVNVNQPDSGSGGAYEVDFHEHEFLSHVVGVQSDGETTNPALWSGDADGDYSHITSHSDPLVGKRLIYTAGTSGTPAGYFEVMFDCDDVNFIQVPDLAPKSEAVVLYKRVLVDGTEEIDLENSPLIAYFDGASVALDPNGSDVNLVVSVNGLMRWGVGY